jgi:hypothetical protein
MIAFDKGRFLSRTPAKPGRVRTDITPAAAVIKPVAKTTQPPADHRSTENRLLVASFGMHRLWARGLQSF